MEILQSLYQKRLNSLANSFFNLLQQLQNTLSPFSQPQLTHHRIDYLRHIITSTLQSDRQTFIKQLFEEIEDLKAKLTYKSQSLADQHFGSKQLSRNSTCSRESEEMKESFENKCSNLSQNIKKAMSKSPSSFEQTYSSNQVSICESNVTSILKKKNNNSKSQTSINFQNNLKSRIDLQPKKEEEKFEFKYLRIGKC